MNNLPTQKILQDLINKYAKGDLKETFSDYKHTCTHVYYNKDGTISFFKIRLNNFAVGKQNKWIRPFHEGKNGNYLIGEPKFNQGKPLYRLPELMKRTEEPVYLLEGETCVEAIESYGFLATTSGSASSVNTTDFSPLANRNIIIFYDYDNAGIKYREDVTSKLQVLGCTVRWVDVEKLNLPDGGDFIDWMKEKGSITKEDILQLPLVDVPKLEDISVIPFSQFDVREDGVFYCKEEGQLPIWLCEKLKITALTRDQNNENWGRVLEFNDADGQLHRWNMPVAFLKGNGEQAIGELLRLGLNIHPGLKQKKYLVEYIAGTPIKTKVRCVSHVGWHGESFVLPHKVYYPSDDVKENLLYQSDYTLHHYGQLGTLDEWKAHVASPCEGNTRLTFGVSQAFVGALIGWLGLESGGFHLVGESSIGKSTILSVMASVYGNENYVHNLRATDNALEGVAVQHNHTLLIMDELSQLNPRIAGEVFYMLANGQSKSRAFKTGQTKNRSYWRTSFITSGELSLKSLLESAGQTIRAGQEIRSVNISADAGKGYGVFDNLHGHKDGASLSNYLKEQCKLYYGSASDAFLTRLVKEDKTAIKERWRLITTLFLKHIRGEEAHGQVKRVAERFALVTLAGVLASEWGITGWKIESVTEAGIACFDSWFKEHREGVTNSSEEEKIFEQVRHFFESNPKRFDAFDGPDLQQTRVAPEKRAGFKSAKDEYYVFTKTFNKEICKGYESRTVAQLLAKKGLLLISKLGNKMSVSKRVPSEKGKVLRLYHFAAHIISASEEEKN